MPRWPLEFTKTAAPPETVAPLIPLIKVAVIIEVPIRMVLLSPGTPETLKPILMFSSPVVRSEPALQPKAVLWLPVVLRASAPSPTAVLNRLC